MVPPDFRAILQETFSTKMPMKKKQGTVFSSGPKEALDYYLHIFVLLRDSWLFSVDLFALTIVDSLSVLFSITGAWPGDNFPPIPKVLPIRHEGLITMGIKV